MTIAFASKSFELILDGELIVRVGRRMVTLCVSRLEPSAAAAFRRHPHAVLLFGRWLVECTSESAAYPLIGVPGWQ